MCVIMPNFIKIGRVVAEIWRMNGFQNGDCPPPWIFEFQIFNGQAVKTSILHHHAKFCEDQSNRC